MEAAMSILARMAMLILALLAVALVTAALRGPAPFVPRASAQEVAPAKSVPPAPAGHRQPKASDVAADDRAGADFGNSAPAPTAAQKADDERAHKILNSVCSHC
jgi:hypothetical protein